jgi:SNF2 family DNA or RNA helicase
MIRYEADQHHIYLNNPLFNQHHMKEVINAVKVKRGWKLPRNLWVYRELYVKFPELKNNPQFMNDAHRMSEQYNRRNAFKQNEDASGNSKLRNYQRVDANFLSKLEYGAVFNEMRTGKTPTIIEVLNIIQPLSTVVIVPSSLVYNWEKEINNWGNGLMTFVYAGTPRAREKVLATYNRVQNKVLIMSKDTLKKDIAVIRELSFDIAIIDEAHFLRNYKTTQSQSIYQVKADRKFCLTGTPVIRKSDDIFGILHFLDPIRFNSYWQFVDRYFMVNDNHWGGKEVGRTKPHREKELLGIIEQISVQRKQKQVLQWLPERQYKKLYAPLNKKQQKLYDDMLNDFMATDDSGNEVDTMNVLSQLTRLRQITIDPRLIGLDVVGEKTKVLMDYLDTMNEPMVVMSMFSSYFKLLKPELEKVGKRVGIIDGSVPQKEKFKVAQDFQKGSIDVLLCNIISAGVGFTLDKGKEIIFIDQAWNPAENDQAEVRILPTTKEKLHSVTITHLVAPDTVDERIQAILETKEDLTKMINKTGLRGLVEWNLQV